MEESAFTIRDGIALPVLQGEPPKDAKHWGDLTPEQKSVAMAGQVTWEGFDAEQETAVIENVVSGKPPYEWMEGVDVGTAEIDRKELFDEWRADEHAARVRDYGEADAATYEQRVVDGAERMAIERIESGLRSMKLEPDILLLSTQHFVQPDPEDMGSVYDTCDTLGPWDSLKEAEKLRVLEGEFNWKDVSGQAKESLLAREVDFSKISRDELNAVYDDPRVKAIDERPARRLFDEANFARAMADQSLGFDDQLALVRDTTRNMIESVMLDTWPRNAAVIDFGLDSPQHYEALYYPLREGEIMPAALDAALGHGANLTTLTRNAPSNPHKEVEFSTSWDGILGRDVPGGCPLRGGEAGSVAGSPDREGSRRAESDERKNRLGPLARRGGEPWKVR